MQKPLLILCCPECRCAVFAMVWDKNFHTMEMLREEETLETFEWGLRNGYVLNTIDAETDELKFQDCECLDKLPLFQSSNTEQVAA